MLECVEPLLPAQLARRWSQHLPETRLCAAVLAEAIDTAQQVAVTDRRQRARDDARAWIMADDHTWPYSFVNLCAVFDLNPELVRTALRAGRRHAA